MPGSSDEVRRLHDQARREREARLEQMTPIERMEEAYRLYRLTAGGEGGRTVTEFTGLLNNIRACMDRERIPFAVGGAFALAAHGHPRYTPTWMALMLLREATHGDPQRVSERLRDIEILARETELDWDEIRAWVERMGYDEAYRDLRIDGKPPLEGAG